MHFLRTVVGGGGAIFAPDSARSMMHHQIDDLCIDVAPWLSWDFGFGGVVMRDQSWVGCPQANGTWTWGRVYCHH